MYKLKIKTLLMLVFLIVQIGIFSGCQNQSYSVDSQSQIQSQVSSEIQNQESTQSKVSSEIQKESTQSKVSSQNKRLQVNLQRIVNH